MRLLILRDLVLHLTDNLDLAIPKGACLECLEVKQLEPLKIGVLVKMPYGAIKKIVTNDCTNDFRILL